MTIYMKAEVHVRPGMMDAFVELMHDVKAIFTSQGWELDGGYITLIGQHGTVTNIWKIPDMNAYLAMMQYLAAMAGADELKRRLREIVESESNSFVMAAPYR